MRKPLAANLVWLVCAGSILGAQSPSFDVASVKRNTSGEPQSVPPIQPGGRLTLTNRTLRSLIQFAYSLPDAPLQEYEIAGGPDWADRDRFDVLAKMEGTPAPGRETAERVRLMFRTLLADRFQLQMRRELRELPVYTLELVRSDARLGSGLRRRIEPNCDWFVPGRGMSDPNGSAPLCGYLRGGRGTLTYRGVTMVRLASGLSAAKLDRIVVDRTGLSGLFDVDLTWNVEPAGAASSDAPSIFTALQEQLGLKLEPKRAPVELWVIESAQPPEPD